MSLEGKQTQPLVLQQAIISFVNPTKCAKRPIHAGSVFRCVYPYVSLGEGPLGVHDQICVNTCWWYSYCTLETQKTRQPIFNLRWPIIIADRRLFNEQCSWPSCCLSFMFLEYNMNSVNTSGLLLFSLHATPSPPLLFTNWPLASCVRTISHVCLYWCLGVCLCLCQRLRLSVHTSGLLIQPAMHAAPSLLLTDWPVDS